jgi:hypothetical protein
VRDDRCDVKRAWLILVGFLLALAFLTSLALVFVPRFRLAGLAGLAVVLCLSVVWALALRRSRAVEQTPGDAPRTTSASAELDEANPIWNQPTWRDDANGRVGPKW